MFEALGYVPGKSLEDKEKEIGGLMDALMDDNRKLMKQNTKLMEENTKLMKENKEKEIPPLKVSLRSSRKKRPWCWGMLMVLMAFIQVIAMGNGQKTARRHLIACLKEIEYFYGFRFLVIEENEEPDTRKG